MGRWERWKDNKVWQGGKGRRMVKWEGGRFLVLYLFVSDVNQGNEGAVLC